MFLNHVGPWPIAFSPRSLGDCRFFHAPDDNNGGGGGGGDDSDKSGAGASTAKKEGAEVSDTKDQNPDGKQDGNEPDKKEDGDKKDEPETLTMTKAEYEAALKKKADETTARINRQKEREANEAKAKQLQEQGDFKTLSETQATQIKERDTTIETLEAKVKELELQVAGKDLKTLKAQVAGEHKLSTTVAKYLQGETREELVASAKELAKEFGTKAAPPTENGGQRANRQNGAHTPPVKTDNFAFAKPGDVAW